jgi:hypothetical protein
LVVLLPAKRQDGVLEIEDGRKNTRNEREKHARLEEGVPASDEVTSVVDENVDTVRNERVLRKFVAEVLHRKGGSGGV